MVGSIAMTCLGPNEAGMKQLCFVVGIKKKRSERYVDLSGVDLVGVEGLITKKIIKKDCIKL